MTLNKLLAPASGKTAPSFTLGFLPKTVTNPLTLFVSKQLLSCSLG